MKRLVTEAFPLDIRQLARENQLVPWSTFERVWRRDRSSQQARVRVTVLEEALQITYPRGSPLVQQTIQLTYSSGSQGGTRPWFLCPACQQRVGIVYYQVGLPFRCRRCSDLAYRSQYPSRDCSYSKQHRLLGRLGKARILNQTAVVQENGGLAGTLIEDMKRVL